MQKQTPYSAPRTQAGFCKQKDPIHQLKSVIMALGDAKLFHKDMNALIVDLTNGAPPAMAACRRTRLRPHLHPQSK